MVRLGEGEGGSAFNGASCESRVLVRGGPVGGVAGRGELWGGGVPFVCIKVREGGSVKTALVNAVIRVQPIKDPAPFCLVIQG